LYAGRYWGEDEPIRADESFTLLTRDVIDFIAYPPFPLQHEFYGGCAFSRFFSPFKMQEYHSHELLAFPFHEGGAGFPSEDKEPFCGRLLSSHHVSPDLINQIWEEKRQRGGQKPAHWVSLKSIEKVVQARKNKLWTGY